MDKPKIENYTIIKRCGFGAYGEVWLAKDKTDIDCAIKFLDIEKLTELNALDREKSALKVYRNKIKNHKNLIYISHVGETDKYLYYVMSLADDIGENNEYKPDSLKHRLDTNAILSYDEIIKISNEVLDGLEVLHTEDLIHRDVKPDNIIFKDGIAQLADIGLVTDDGSKVSMIGTAGYLPINKKMDKLSDLYALGKVIYTSFTGKLATSYPDISDMKLTAENKHLNSIVNSVCADNGKELSIEELRVYINDKKMEGYNPISDDEWFIIEKYKAEFNFKKAKELLKNLKTKYPVYCEECKRYKNLEKTICWGISNEPKLQYLGTAIATCAKKPNTAIAIFENNLMQNFNEYPFELKNSIIKIYSIALLNANEQLKSVVEILMMKKDLLLDMQFATCAKEQLNLSDNEYIEKLKLLEFKLQKLSLGVQKSILEIPLSIDNAGNNVTNIEKEINLLSRKVENEVIVIVQAYNGKYITQNREDDSILGAWADTPRIRDYFFLEYQDNDKVFIRNSQDKYVMVNYEKNNILYACSETAGERETFTIIYEEDKFSLQASNGKYVSADSTINGVITANRDHIDTWEKFKYEEVK